ncbi:hypothetical protein [Clostridium tetani]|uniref:hypothetical protein n=1 Tax=Clostridium tetani TaxID=1513 RepID=UPI00100BE53C|nr:hypothetical protein [Clostridium tetani]RXM74376.1 hypothetical protein DP143_00325 [Clostridium tetani]
MNSIYKGDYEKLKRQFDIKMRSEGFPLAIAFWTIMGIILEAFLMIVSTEKGYTISSGVIVNYLFITLISINYLLISLIINTIGKILFKENSEKIIPTFLIFILPMLLTSSKVFISNYNIRILTYISPIIILTEMYFEYKIIMHMDV